MGGYQIAKICRFKYMSRFLRLLDNMWVQLKFYKCDCIVHVFKIRTMCEVFAMV